MLGLHVPCMQLLACVFERFRLALKHSGFRRMVVVVVVGIVSFFYNAN